MLLIFVKIILMTLSVVVQKQIAFMMVVVMKQVVVMIWMVLL